MLARVAGGGGGGEQEARGGQSWMQTHTHSLTHYSLTDLWLYIEIRTQTSDHRLSETQSHNLKRTVPHLDSDTPRE